MISPKRIKLSDMKEKFACFVCNKIVNDPIKLPCNASICSEHIKSLVSNLFDCKFCFKDHIVPQKGFNKDIELKKQIDSETYLTDYEKQQKSSLNSLFGEMFELISDFDLKFNAFEYFSHEHFAELERRIELRRENLKREIDDISCEMIKKVKEKKEKFVKDARNNEISGLRERIERDKLECQEKFRLLDFSIQAIQDLQVQQEKHLSELQEKFSKFDQLRSKVEKIGFASTTNFESKIFGRFTKKLKYLVRIHGINSCEIWNLETDKLLKKNELTDDDDEPFRILSYEVIDETNLLTLCDDGFFRVYDLKSDALLKKFGNAISSEDDFKFFQSIISNKNLTVIKYEKYINFYNLKTGDLEKSLKLENLKYFKILGLLDNGNILCSFGTDKKKRVIYLIDFDTGNIVKSFNDHINSVLRIRLLPNNKFVSSSQSVVIVWDIETGKRIKRLHANDANNDQFLGTACDFELSNDGKLICLYIDEFLDFNSRIKIFDTLNNYECVRTINIDDIVFKIKLHTHDKLAAQLDYSPFKPLINVYSITTGECLKGLKLEQDTFEDIMENFDFCSFFDLKDA